MKLKNGHFGTTKHYGQLAQKMSMCRGITEKLNYQIMLLVLNVYFPNSVHHFTNVDRKVTIAYNS